MRVVEIVLIVVVCCRKIEGKPQQTRPGCWYEGKRYQEFQVVNTTEPCLRCRCNEGSLRCRLRVCPRLPSPMPSGCIARSPRDNACCAELVCGDSHERNVTARRDPAKDIRSHDNGCLHEGVRYGPGSAMMGSRRCEYCYCISGDRRCLRPKCLLPLAGCTPLYAPYSCCPVAYNCTNSAHHSVPNVASSSSGNGCRVGNRRYEEGEMVRDIEHKADCDNCFCAMGGVRCVPLACAPPLQGCTPIVRQGHCCPSTYNCSGSIEVKAAQNYASYAFISKDYAKFRKETNFFSMDIEEVVEDDYESSRNSTVEGRGHKNTEATSASTEFSAASTSPSFESLLNSVTAKTLNNSDDLTVQNSATNRETSTPISRESSDNKSTTISSFEMTETMDNEIPTETMDYGKSSTIQQETTTIEIGWTTTISPAEYSETQDFDTTEENHFYSSTEAPTETFSTEETLGSTNSMPYFQDREETSIPESSTMEETSESTEYSTTESFTTIEEDEATRLTSTFSLTEVRNTLNEHSNVTEEESSEAFEVTTKSPKLFETLLNNVERNISKSSHEAAGETLVSAKGASTASPTTVVMPDNILVINVTLKTNVSVGHPQGITINPIRSIPPDIQAILNITHRKKGDDYDYEYSQPTLPPSLPNVRIIPFVAADALVKNDEEIPVPVTNYPVGPVGIPPQELGPTVAGTMTNFYDIATQENRFSPPIETEGGFVPREPPYFDPLYHSTDLNLEIRTGVTVAPADITNPHRKSDELATNCRFENRDFRHGDLLPSSGHCIICICYYGEVTCSDEKCPPLKIGCRRLENEKICCGKIICVDSDESPTVVLDRGDPVAASPRQPLPAIDGVVSPDPFRDVIKTERAPDLPSLIEDMLPYLAERRITKPSSATTPMSTSEAVESIKVHSHYQLEPSQNFPMDTTNQSIYLLDEASKFNETLMLPINETSSLNPESSTTTSSTIIETAVEFTTIQPISRLESPTKLNSEEKPPEDPFLLSFGNVFQMLFSDNTGATSTKISDSLNSEQTIGETGNPEGLVYSAEKTTEKESLDNKNTSTITWIKMEEVTSETIGNSATTYAADNEIGNTQSNSLLKLAGCNIYGRMYRVGRIITELSNPCLECRCTEIGVQCKQLEC